VTTTTPLGSTLVFDRLVDLAACLCQQVDDLGLPSLCRCGVVPGDAVVLDLELCTGNGGKCGQGWVRLNRAYDASALGVPNIVPRACGPMFAMEVEVGIARCGPVPDSRGRAPSVDDMLAAAQLQMLDMQAIRLASVCCFDDLALLGDYLPVNGAGAVVGGSALCTGWVL
jgi:hypothetical protein